ncbi:MAG: TRAP transporter substrate-binding protein [Bacteroidota bacterium]
MKLNRYFIDHILFLFPLLFIECKGGTPQEPEFLLRASLLTNEQHTQTKAFQYFEKILWERSGGRIKLETYPAEQMAKEIEAIRLIQAGVIDIAVTGSLLNNWIEIAAFCELPFLLRDSTDMLTLINGSVGKRIEKEILEKTGLRIVGYFEAGARHLTSNRPIRHPDELNGLIVRVPSVPSFVTAWGALGAKPTPMAYSEVFISLQQGTIEAQENPLATIKAGGFAEVQQYVNMTGHVISWVYPVIGEKQFQRFPDDLKEIFLEAAQDMQEYEHQLFLEGSQTVKNELEAAGMEFIEVDKTAFIEKAQGDIYHSLSPEMQAVYDEVIEQIR